LGKKRKKKKRRGWSTNKKKKGAEVLWGKKKRGVKKENKEKWGGTQGGGVAGWGWIVFPYPAEQFPDYAGCTLGSCLGQNGSSNEPPDAVHAVQIARIRWTPDALLPERSHAQGHTGVSINRDPHAQEWLARCGTGNPWTNK